MILSFTSQCHGETVALSDKWYPFQLINSLCMCTTRADAECPPQEFPSISHGAGLVTGPCIFAQLPIQADLAMWPYLTIALLAVSNFSVGQSKLNVSSKEFCERLRDVDHY